jgi:hypothetical protein
VVTEKGKRIPLDKEPHPNGNVHVYDGTAYVLDKWNIADHKAEGGKLYVSHFATCPNATQHRKRT